ncbi:MAG: hypothetical protein AAF696_27290 [Bacteroidota bacterium]
MSQLNEMMLSINYAIEGSQISSFGFNVRKLEAQFEIIITHIGEKPNEDKKNNMKSGISLGGRCPKGLGAVGLCFSSECVEEYLMAFSEVIERGDSFSVHHGGLGGVTVCANERLADAIQH